jgi:hypothetical protein
LGLQLTSSDQVLALAPDSDSAKNGKKLGTPKFWKNLGQNAEALWGACQGSGKDPYQVQVDTTTLTMKCSCPSRKHPCKHCLGLLLIAVGTPSVIPVSEPPEWVATWLAKRATTIKRKEAKESEVSTEAQLASQKKRADKRLAQVMKGLDRLDLWLNDIVRNGLAGVETQPATFWETQAAEMANAQAAGLDSRLRRMASIPNSSPDWPEKLLGQLGQLALLTHTFRRIDELDAALQEDVRQLIGWRLEQEEAAARGELVSDDWLILGQKLVDNDKVREQRTWLLGASTGRPAMILQFAFGQEPFKDVFPVGTRQAADLAFYPGAAPQRAQLMARRGELLPITGPFAEVETIEAFLARVAAILARHPWQERFLCTLKNVTPICDNNGARWYIRESGGAALPLSKGNHWLLLALSGGMPLDFAAEWNGETLSPLGVLVNGKYAVV